MKYVLIACITLIFISTSCEDNKDALIIIHTEYGDMKAILYEETPLHKNNFITLAKSGKYDSTTWHRVIENFMIQGGDINSKEGTQEAEEDRIPAEIIDKFYHTKGALAAARQSDGQNPKRLSSSTQFYIIDGKVFSTDELTVDQYKLNEQVGKLLLDDRYDTLKQKFVQLQIARDQEGIQKLANQCKDLVEKEYGVDVSKEFDPERLKLYTTIGGAYHLDGNYTIFGKVVEGLDVIDKIAAVKTSRGDKPVKDTYLTMEVAFVPKKMITEKYGYQYPEKEK